MTASPKNDHVIFQAELDKLEPMMRWIRERALKAGFSIQEARKVELAMEEALVNIIRHAYKEGKGVVEINCRIYPRHRIEFTIMDKGPPFNPLLQVQKINPQVSLEERQEGGLGIFFIRQNMDQVHYERQHPYNVLTLIKEYSSSP